MYDEICMVGGKSRPIRRSALGGGVEAWAFVDADSSFSGPGLGYPLRHHTVGLDAPMCRRMVKGGDCWLHVGSILTSGMDLEFSSKVGRVLFQAINPRLGGYSTLRDRWISGVFIMAYYPHFKRVLPR